MPDALLSGGYIVSATIRRERLIWMLETALRISDRVTMVTDIDGIVIRGVDSACVAILEVSLPRESFETFEGVFAHVDADIMEVSNLLDVMDGDILTFEIDIYKGYLGNEKETQEFHASMFEPREFPIPVTYDAVGVFQREWLINILGAMNAEAVWVGIDNEKEICVLGKEHGGRVSYRVGAEVVESEGRQGVYEGWTQLNL